MTDRRLLSLVVGACLLLGCVPALAAGGPHSLSDGATGDAVGGAASEPVHGAQEATGGRTDRATADGTEASRSASGIPGIDVSYRPSLQTQHLALFGALTVVAFLVGSRIYRTRQTRGAHLFAASLFALGLRAGSDLLHGLIGELWSVLGLLVAVNPILELLTLVLFVRFAGRYAGLRQFHDERATKLMAAVVVLAVAVVATNPFHGLVFDTVSRYSEPFTYVATRHGPLGHLLVAVNGVFLFTGAGLLAHTFTGGTRTSWWPAAVLSVAVSQAVLIGVLQVTIGGVLPQHQYGAIGLGAFVLLSTLALVDHGLRRIEVIARREILDDIDDAVVFLDPGGTVADFNAAASRVFRDIEAGDPFSDQFDEPVGVPRDEDATTTEVTVDPSAMDPDRAAQARSSDDVDSSDGRSQRSDPLHFLVHTTRLTAETGETLGYTVRFVDVTDLEERSRELRRKNEQLDQFASTVSHDLRNPLTVASGYLEMVAGPVESDDPTDLDLDAAVTYLEKVGVSLDRMTVIIDDIVALIENADPVTDTEPVDYREVVASACETVDTKRASVTLASDGAVEADATRLQRLLENLFRNAVDHVGPDVAIETGVTDDGFYVADDGPGIPEADRDQIFDHGFTTGDDGTGLGLSIVTQLAEAHGWEVSLDPDHDGAKFVVSGCEVEPRSAAPASDR